MNSYYMINAELNGVEIYFEDKPEADIREALKANRFRWNGRKKCWYAKQSEERIALAEKIASGEATAEQIQTEIQPATAATLTAEGMKEAAKNYTTARDEIRGGWTGCNVGPVYGQELKKAILGELKKNGIKATARSGRGGWTDSFKFTVMVPKEYQMTLEEYITEKSTDHHTHWFRDCTNNKDINFETLWNMEQEERERIIREHWTHTYEYNTSSGKAVPKDEFVKFVRAIVDSFNADHSDPMTDYFDVRFYDSYTWKAA